MLAMVDSDWYKRKFSNKDRSMLVTQLQGDFLFSVLASGGSSLHIRELRKHPLGQVAPRSPLDSQKQSTYHTWWTRQTTRPPTPGA